MREIKHLNLRTFDRDGRISVGDLFESYERFDEELWKREIIHWQSFKTLKKRRKHKLPILGFRTKKFGPAIWIISGIHGEEPAGPNAISRHVGFLNDLARKLPMVVLPMCNPVGYVSDWRYPYSRRVRRNESSKSVGSSEHCLLDATKTKPRARIPDCEESEEITGYVLKYLRRYPPVLVLDFHEDESSSSFYIYSQGILGSQDPVAKEVVRVLVERGFALRSKGKTQFGEEILGGIVGRVKDGSIDELIAAKKAFIGGEVRKKKYAKSVVVVETSIKNFALDERIRVHEDILLSAEKFFYLAKSIKKKLGN